MMSAGIWLIAAAVLVVLPTAARSEIEERKHCQTARCLPTCFPGIGPDGCPSCDCPPTCQDHPCPDDEECVLQDVRCKNKRKHCFPRPTCVPKDVTTVGPTSTVCPSNIPCGDPPFCYLDYTPGEICPVCLCFDPACMLLGCPDGQTCLPTGECPTCFECLPKFVTTTDIPTNTPIPLAADIPRTTTRTITTSECPIPPCAVGCHQVPGSNGCPICDCTTQTCQEVACDYGQECVMQCPSDTTPCFPQPTCVPIIYETTTPCPLIRCTADCVTETGSDGCPRCNCPPTCQTVKCSAGYECRLVNVTCIRYPCFPRAQCVSTEETTTTKQCRTVKCLPTCVPGIGPDGCPSCDCPPTCQDYPCPDYEECVLQIVRCKDKKKNCFPQPTCIPKKRKQ